MCKVLFTFWNVSFSKKVRVGKGEKEEKSAKQIDWGLVALEQIGICVNTETILVRNHSCCLKLETRALSEKIIRILETAVCEKNNTKEYEYF